MTSGGLPRADTILLCASITTVGLYACLLWERSLRCARHRLYVDAAIRVIDVLWNGGSPPPRETRGRAARGV